MCLEEFTEIHGRNTGIDFIVHLNGNADGIAFSKTEASGERNFIFKMVLFYGFLHAPYDFWRTFEMAGTAYTDLDNHRLTASPERSPGRTRRRCPG